MTTDFERQLEEAYKRKVVEPLEKTVRQVAIFVDGELVDTTPVDTGRAKANWLPSINQVLTDTVEPDGKPDMTQAITSYKLADTIFITNNLPYIRRLNEGSSKKAPAGFVDTAIARGKRLVKGIFRAKVTGKTR